MPDVTRSFGAKHVSESVGQTGIGNPTCRFTMTGSNLHVPGTVAVTLAAHVSRSIFARERAASRGAVTIARVGDRAFFVPGTGLLYLMKGAKSVIVQPALRVPAGPTPDPRGLRRDVVALGKSIALDL